MRYFLALFVLFSFQNNFAQYITIDENYTAQQLVQDILINNGCASISNVSVTGANFTTGEKSFGYFSGSGTTFPFGRGVILSTGKVASAPGPTTPLADDGNNIVWGGDSDLNQSLNISSINATVLEFDFVPLGNKISFRYIFSSEEYKKDSNYPCRFSDSFAFLLKPIGAPSYQNIALIPNTTIPVKVTTVRPEITAPGGCPAQNEQYFDQFNGIEHPTVYDGQTVVMTAQSAVTPNTQYHIKLIIADENTGEYDSAIFIEAGSFDLGVNLGEDRTVTGGNPICPNSIFTLDASASGAPNYQWNFNGTPIPGETNATLTFDTTATTYQNGTYSVTQIFNATCQPVSDIIIEFAPPNVLSAITDFTECDDSEPQDGIRTFDLDSLIPLIYPTLPAGYQVAFFESQNAINQLPSNYSNTIPSQQIIYAKVITGNCYQPEPITLNIKTFDEYFPDETIYLCDNKAVVLNPGSNFKSYSWNTTPVQTSPTIAVNSPGTYEVILQNNEDCYKTKTYTIIGSEIASIQPPLIEELTDNNSATIIATGIGEYVYSINGVTFQQSNVFENLTSGEYPVYVKDINGCGIATDTFIILDYPKFFTPNGDGYNDRWKIANLEKRKFENSELYIFDKYGKLLKQISQNGNGWDGTYNGEQLPAQDYWFVLKLGNGRIVKSHFTLKR